MKTTALTFLIVMVVSSSVVLGADMFSGTWKVSVAKSKFDPGPGLKEQIVKFQAVGRGLESCRRQHRRGWQNHS